jgi:hypothetical protein
VKVYIVNSGLNFPELIRQVDDRGKLREMRAPLPQDFASKTLDLCKPRMQCSRRYITLLQ